MPSNANPAFPSGAKADAKREPPQRLAASVAALGCEAPGLDYQAVSKVLVNLADVLELRDGIADTKVAEVRFQAERLARSDALSFGQTTWIKAGLIAALDALDALEPQQREFSGTSAARQAVMSIDARDLLGFQRPEIQDAFRATVDAFGVAAPSITECQG
jgi:hypothetical protein